MAALTKFYQYVPYVVFDGTNAAECVSVFNSNAWSATGDCVASLVSQTGGVAVIRLTNADGTPGSVRTVTLNTGDCLPINYGPFPTSAANQALNYTALSPVSTAPTVPTAVKYGGAGQALIGALTVGSTNLTVTIKPAQPDTGYVASAFLDGPTLALGTVSLGTPVNLTGSTVRVPVINSGLVPLTLSSGTVSVNVTAPQS